MKKIFSYDNFEGDKGIILADSLEEAKEIYKKEYPNRQIATNDEEYYDCGCYMSEIDTIDDTSKLVNLFPW